MDAHGDSAHPDRSHRGGRTGEQATARAGQASIVSHDFDALANDPRLAFVCVYSMMDDDVPGFGLLNPDRSKRQAWNVYASRSGS